MSLINAVIEGIIQALTEFLPISSSGHLAVYNYFFNKNEGDTFFTILLHIGTLIAVIICYHKTIWELIKEFFKTIGDIFTGKFKWSQMNPTRRMLIMLIICMLPLALFLPVKDYVDVAAKNIFLLSLCFIFTGVILMLGHFVGKRSYNREKMTVWDSLCIGFMQGLAIFPGISRSGSTISAGLVLGLKKEHVTQFSFILSIPTILGSFLIELYDNRSELANVDFVPVIVGIIVAAIFGVLAIKLIEFIIKKNKFNIFSIYCLVLGFGLMFCYLYQSATGNSVAAMLGLA
ncbi:MAG: undecaprenyl-diphosphate phosphatase [Clostridia bacterium]|nr:undecaprenyl-diphosphate phosphatase [Clostridia bacterium]